MEVEQMDLLPSSSPSTGYVSVDIDELRYEVGGPAPTRQLVESIRRLGILDPLKVTYDAESQSYWILDGRRRYLAAREVGMARVPCTLFANEGEFGQYTIQLASHAQRSRNPVAELRAIEALVAAGATEADIFRATGLTVQEQRERLVLTRLEPVLRIALEKGEINPSVGKSAAKLPPQRQEQLIAVLVEKGQLKERDVKEVRQAVQDGALRQIDFSAMGDVPSVEPRASMREQLETLLSEFNSISHEDARARIETILGDD